jgi:hypothetical protein
MAVATSSGDIETKMKVKNESKTRNSLSATVGEGQKLGRVEVSTSSGDITIF